MKLVMLLFITLMLTGCDPGRTRIYSTNDCLENYKPANLNSIISSASKYDSSYVEITGFYQWGTEATAISNSKASQYENSKVWVEFRFAIVDSLEKNRIGDKNVFKELSGKKIKIRGKIHSEDRGHLEQYAATIKNVCYLEIYNW